PPELRALLDESVAASTASGTDEAPPILPLIPAAQPPATPASKQAAGGLTDAQRKAADLLRSVAAATGTQEPHGKTTTRRRRFFYNLPRLLVAAIVAAAVALPFIDRLDNLRFTPPPPVAFA